VTGLMMALSFT